MEIDEDDDVSLYRLIRKMQKLGSLSRKYGYMRSEFYKMFAVALLIWWRSMTMIFLVFENHGSAAAMVRCRGA
jgi:hypothetical protein